jgi:hypothetical protein
VAGLAVQHEPTDGDVGVAQAVHEGVEFVQDELFGHDALNEEVFAALEALVLFVYELFYVVLDAL